MELIVYAPTQEQFVKSIDFNFEELRQELTVRLETYKGLVYTDESIGEAKKDRASLNKFKEAIETERKEIKKRYLEPYETFEKKIKQLVALVDAPIVAIDSQVKGYEQLLRERKKADITAYYESKIGILSDVLPLEHIYSDRWLNATFKDKDWQDAISKAIERTASDLKTISELHSEYELQIKDAYLRTLDLSAALNEKTRLEAQKARLAEYEARQAEIAVAKEAEEREAQNLPPEPEIIHNTQKPAPIYTPMFTAPEQPITRQIDFRVWATDEQLASLKVFLKNNNIKFGKVE